MAVNPYLDIDRKMLGDIHTSREMMDNLEILCDDYGSRFGGSDNQFGMRSDDTRANIAQIGLLLSQHLRVVRVASSHTDPFSSSIHSLWIRIGYSDHFDLGNIPVDHIEPMTVFSLPGMPDDQRSVCSTHTFSS